MGWEGNPVFVHVSQSLGDWGHLNYHILATDDGTGPKVRGQLGSLDKGELRQEQDFPKISYSCCSGVCYVSSALALLPIAAVLADHVCNVASSAC